MILRLAPEQTQELVSGRLLVTKRNKEVVHLLRLFELIRSQVCLFVCLLLYSCYIETLTELLKDYINVNEGLVVNSPIIGDKSVLAALTCLN